MDPLLRERIISYPQTIFIINPKIKVKPDFLQGHTINLVYTFFRKATCYS